MIAIIGSGNIATWFAYAIKQSGGNISQVYSRDIENARKLASLYEAEPIDNIKLLKDKCSLYLFALNDETYIPVLKEIPFRLPLAVHTAGSISQDIFQNYAERYGVIYPFQSVSKNADFSKLTVPLCVEGNDKTTKDELFQMAHQWSKEVYEIDESQRAYLHIAAVFAGNFVNALYGEAYHILEKQNINPKILWPLMQNVLDKVKTMSPPEAQTGPAVRHERNTMNKHLASLDNEALKEIYLLISKRIQENKK